MTDEAAKTYVEDEREPGLRESATAESDELRDNPENVEKVENVEDVENVDSGENVENADYGELADADEPAGFAEPDEADEVVEADDYTPADEFTEPSDIVAVEEPDYPDYATPSVAQPSATQSDASEPLLASTVTDGFRDRWSEVQIGFVEDPQKSVAEADALLAEVTRAYQQAVEERRSRISAVRQDGSADTEDLRSALLGYREIFTTMVSNDR
ncbi:MAG: hypothetical protein HOV83_06605 [Catenulispora sp.]|nr:hypothetical protein [Catenulispora sp.]